MSTQKIALTTFVTPDHTDKILQVLGQAGAGRVGECSYCGYTVRGKGRWLASEKAHPFLGETSKLGVAEEHRIEVVCDQGDAKRISPALKAVHPYENPVVYICPLLSKEEL